MMICVVKLIIFFQYSRILTTTIIMMKAQLVPVLNLEMTQVGESFFSSDHTIRYLAEWLPK